MVVLEGGGMLSSASNQYLQPDYLSPLPTTLDAKKSPLALLAQTCSQIGADSPPSKSLLASLDKPKKSESRSSPASRESKNSMSIHHHRSTPTNNNNNTSSSPPTEQKLAFKPYETNVLTPKKEESSPRPASKASSSHGSEHDKKSGTPTPMDRKTVSPSNSATPSATATADNGKQSPSTEKSSSPQGRGASPIIRSGLEILQGHKDSALGYKHLSQGLPSSLQGFYPPGLEHTNPAFRPSFPGAPYGSSAHHHAAAAAMLGYSGSAPTPYLSYARVKTPSGGEALVPVCKDPYCTGCQFSMHNQQMLMNAAAAGGAAAQGPCPSGCTQCDHQKYNLAMAMSLGHPSSLAAYSQLGRPYVCSWIVGDNYCGKRFVTSEELLQHLRTHTSGSDAAAAAAAAAVTSASSAMLSPHLFSRPGYPNPPLSPLSAARFHPYGKPPLPTSLPASPYSAFNPTALAPYYSPYSIYGQRLGAAAVHP